ncbi:MAG: IS5 family transposase [Alphaproteobacteria bacterium]
MLQLSNEQWERIKHHFPEENVPEGRPGRKPVPTRRVLEAVLWILNTGAQWHMLPQSYPNYKTVHRRFQQWCDREVLRAVLTDLANELRERGVIDEREAFIDATFASAKGGGAEIGPTRRGKGVKIMAIVDRHGLPLSVSTHAANHHEVTLVQLSFDFYMIEAKPEHLIGDKAYDSDKLDKALAEQDVQMIAPHRENRKLKTQDGRALRRYARRWLVERYFAWLQWKRRILVRWEYYASNFLGFVQLASATMLLKRI